MEKLTAKQLKIETEALEKNRAWQHIKSVMKKDLDETFILISKHIEAGIYATPDKALAELHTQNLLKQRYELISKLLGIPEKIIKSKVRNDSDGEALIKKQL